MSDEEVTQFSAKLPTFDVPFTAPMAQDMIACIDNVLARLTEAELRAAERDLALPSSRMAEEDLKAYRSVLLAYARPYIEQQRRDNYP